MTKHINNLVGNAIRYFPPGYEGIACNALTSFLLKLPEEEQEHIELTGISRYGGVREPEIILDYATYRADPKKTDEYDNGDDNITVRTRVTHKFTYLARNGIVHEELFDRPSFSYTVSKDPEKY